MLINHSTLLLSSDAFFSAKLQGAFANQNWQAKNLLACPLLESHFTEPRHKTPCDPSQIPKLERAQIHGTVNLISQYGRTILAYSVDFIKTTSLEWPTSSSAPVARAFPINPKVILAFPLQALLSFFNQGKSTQLLKYGSRKILCVLAFCFLLPHFKNNFNSLQLFLALKVFSSYAPLGLA